MSGDDGDGYVAAGGYVQALEKAYRKSQAQVAELTARLELFAKDGYLDRDHWRMMAKDYLAEDGTKALEVVRLAQRHIAHNLTRTGAKDVLRELDERFGKAP